MKQDLIYLDNAATVWPKPESIYRFMDHFYRTMGVNPGRSGYDLAIEAGSLLTNLRLRLTKFFGGDEDTPERLIFSYNVTDALNLIIPGLLSAGDHVITTNLKHNSVIRPVNHMVRDHGCEATFLPFNENGFIDLDDMRRAIRRNTKVVIVDHGLERDRHCATAQGNRPSLLRAWHPFRGRYGPDCRSDSHSHEGDEHRRRCLHRP